MEKVQTLAQMWAYLIHSITIRITDSRMSERCEVSRFVVTNTYEEFLRTK